MTIMMNMPNMDILLQENAVLSKELGKLQERSNRLLAEKSKEIELLRQQLAEVCQGNPIQIMARETPSPIRWLESFFHLIGSATGNAHNAHNGHKGV